MHFFRYTPREIRLLLSVYRAREAQKARERWQLGRLFALAFHCPDRLPSCPPLPFSSPEMTADEMKQRLLAWRGKDNTL